MIYASTKRKYYFEITQKFLTHQKTKKINSKFPNYQKKKKTLKLIFWNISLLLSYIIMADIAMLVAEEYERRMKNSRIKNGEDENNSLFFIFFLSILSVFNLFFLGWNCNGIVKCNYYLSSWHVLLVLI